MTLGPATRIQRAARALWALFSLYLLYGTVIPFDILLQRDAVARKVAAIEWMPFVDRAEGGLAPRPDLLANTVLFVPFGLLGFWALRHRGRHTAAVLAVVTGLGLAQSLCIEILQLFTRTRFTATTDLIVNTVGVVLGVGTGVLSVPLVERLRRSESLQRWLRSTAAFPALAATAGVAALTWQPFLFSLDASDLLPKLRALAADRVAVPATITHEPLHFVLFFLFGLAVTALLRENGVKGAAVKAMVLCVAAACMLEPTRLAVHRQLPSAFDLAIRVAACGAGAISAGWITGRRHAWMWCAAMYAATLAALAAAGLSPYRFSSAASDFGWIPLLPYYAQSTVDAVTDATDKVLQVMPFGFVVGLAFPRRRALPATVAAIAAAAAAVEMLQRHVPGRTPDITDVIVAAAGAAIGYLAATAGTHWYQSLVLEADRPQKR